MTPVISQVIGYKQDHPGMCWCVPPEGEYENEGEFIHLSHPIALLAATRPECPSLQPFSSITFL
jgi:hypothetical protein